MLSLALPFAHSLHVAVSSWASQPSPPNSSLTPCRYKLSIFYNASITVFLSYHPSSLPWSPTESQSPTMASNRLRRIGKELADIQNDKDSSILCQTAHGDDITHLLASFPGPPDTPYEGGTYVVDVKLPNEYPFRPPVMFFKTKLWHPNVSSQTVGCLLSGHCIR